MLDRLIKYEKTLKDIPVSYLSLSTVYTEANDLNKFYLHFLIIAYVLRINRKENFSSQKKNNLNPKSELEFLKRKNPPFTTKSSNDITFSSVRIPDKDTFLKRVIPNFDTFYNKEFIFKRFSKARIDAIYKKSGKRYDRISYEDYQSFLGLENSLDVVVFSFKVKTYYDYRYYFTIDEVYVNNFKAIHNDIVLNINDKAKTDVYTLYEGNFIVDVENCLLNQKDIILLREKFNSQDFEILNSLNKSIAVHLSFREGSAREFVDNYNEQFPSTVEIWNLANEGSQFIISTDGTSIVLIHPTLTPLDGPN